MLVVVSPAKKLNAVDASVVEPSSFSKNVDELVSNMQKFSVDELKTQWA